MSYYITQSDTVFEVKKKHIATIEKQLQTLVRNKKLWHNQAQSTPDLESIMIEYGWSLSYSNNGDIDHIILEGDRATEDKLIFETFAPYIEPDSYIRLIGEEGESWELRFNGKDVEEVAGYLDFENSAEILGAIIKQKSILPTLMGIHTGLDKLIDDALRKE